MPTYRGKLHDKLEEYDVKGIQTAIKSVKKDHRIDVVRENSSCYAICSANEKVRLEET